MRIPVRVSVCRRAPWRARPRSLRKVATALTQVHVDEDVTQTVVFSQSVGSPNAALAAGRYRR